MKLELLANELLLELFEFFDGIHLFHAFYGLNTRFNTLLLVHFRNYTFDFRTSSKRNFDLMCQQFLPSIIDRVTSLCLSNGDEIPNLFDRFLSYGFILSQFTHLHSLSLIRIVSIEKIITMLTEFSYFTQLTRLKLIKCYIQHEDDFFHLMNNIWCLPKLTYCDLDINKTNSDHLFWRLTMTSTSIESISVRTIHMNLRDLSNLSEHTPQLRHLYINLSSDSININLPIYVFSSIMKLNVVCESLQFALIHLLKSMPNLSHLKLQASRMSLNGHEWKKVIENHLPKMKIFRFYMLFHLWTNTSMENQVDELIKTFRTPFWLDEHQWFVRCHWDSQEQRLNAHLYTLTYCFDKLSNWPSNIYYKSTCPNDRDFFSYNNVQVIENLYGNSVWLSPICFSNLHDMNIELPIHETIWSCIPTLDHLISLTVCLNRDTSISDVQALINRTHRLYSLTLRGNIGFQVWKIKSTSIRRLDLTLIGYFNATQCSALVNSVLGCQCEVLLIHVLNRSQILNLVNTMPNLRTLACRCGDDLKVRARSLSTTNDLLVWLKNHLPSTFSISREPTCSKNIQLWI